MIRTFALILALLSLAACGDGYNFVPEARPEQQEQPHQTVINQLTVNSSTTIVYDDGQRAGEHRGQVILACSMLSHLRDYLDGYQGYLGCQNMQITTAEDMGYYRGHHIIRFMNHGLFYYGANDYQPPRANPSDYCYDNYGHSRRLLKQCLNLNAFD